MTIVLEAREWIGTRFKHQGRVKKTIKHDGGCDCLGLIVNLGLRTKYGDLLNLYDQISYSRANSSNILLTQLDLLLDKVEFKNIQPGDLILLRINNWPQHLAIISSVRPIKIIHSYIQAKKVVEHHLPEEWQNRIMAIYRSNNKIGEKT
jgi:cell wall-associated NlpC family hydrolase